MAMNSTEPKGPLRRFIDHPVTRVAAVPVALSIIGAELDAIQDRLLGDLPVSSEQAQRLVDLQQEAVDAAAADRLKPWAVGTGILQLDSRREQVIEDQLGMTDWSQHYNVDGELRADSELCVSSRLTSTPWCLESSNGKTATFTPAARFLDPVTIDLPEPEIIDDEPAGGHAYTSSVDRY